MLTTDKVYLVLTSNTNMGGGSYKATKMKKELVDVIDD